MTTDLSRLRKSRSANRNVLKGMLLKIKETGHAGLNEQTRQEIADMLKVVSNNRKLIAELDRKVLDVIDEESIDEEVEKTIERTPTSDSGIVSRLVKEVRGEQQFAADGGKKSNTKRELCWTQSW